MCYGNAALEDLVLAHILDGQLLTQVKLKLVFDFLFCFLIESISLYILETTFTCFFLNGMCIDLGLLYIFTLLRMNSSIY